ALRHAHFTTHARRRHVGVLEVAHGRLVRLRRRLLDEPELNRLVTVGLHRLRLHDDARAGLDHGGGMHGAVRIEHLRHPDFSADDSCHHSYQLSALSYQLSALSYQLSALSYQLSATALRL